MKLLHFILIVIVFSVSNANSQYCNFIYVTPWGNGEQGTIDNPTDIVTALKIVDNGRNHICLLKGNYIVSQTLRIPSNIVLEGGYISTNDLWEKVSTEISKITIYPVLKDTIISGQNIGWYMGIDASNSSGFYIKDLTIEVQPNGAGGTTGGSGRSIYGIYLNNASDYTISRCKIGTGNASSGSNGANGLDGLDGNNGSDGDENVSNCDENDAYGFGGAGAEVSGNNPLDIRSGAGGGTGGRGGYADNNGANGSDGQNNYNAQAGGNGGGGGGYFVAVPDRQGLFDTRNYHDGYNGQEGYPGSNGADGNNGQISFVDGIIIPGKGINGQDGKGGTGGGGGGGAGGVKGTARYEWYGQNDRGGGGGGGGGGAQGGQGGTGGGSGGSSIAIFLYDNGSGGYITDCILSAGGAGEGGSGASGGRGGDGGNVGLGGRGSSGSVWGIAGEGGKGGDGGNGGRGGDGADGISAGIYKVNGEDIEQDGSEIPNTYKLSLLNYTFYTNHEVTVIKSDDQWIIANSDSFYFVENLKPGMSSYGESDDTVRIYYLSTGHKDIAIGSDIYKNFIDISEFYTVPEIINIPDSIELKNSFTAQSSITGIEYEWLVFPKDSTSAEYVKKYYPSDKTQEIEIENAGLYYLRLRVKPECSTWSIPVYHLLNVCSHAPQITNIPDQIINQGSIFSDITLDNYVQDNNNDNSELQWSYSSNENLDIIINEEHHATVSVKDTKWYGKETIAFSVSDPAGLTDIDSVCFTVNAIPKISGLMDTLQITADQNAVVSLWDYVEDMETDDANLNYLLEADTNFIKTIFDESNGELTIYADTTYYGTGMIYITVSDEYNATAIDSIIIIVQAPLIIKDNISNLPDKYTLYQNYPNPFNPKTVITYRLPESSNINISVYNIRGEKIVKLVDKHQAAGTYKIEFDGTSLPSGIYFCKFTTNKFSAVRKMILMK